MHSCRKENIWVRKELVDINFHNSKNRLDFSMEILRDYLSRQVFRFLPLHRRDQRAGWNPPPPLQKKESKHLNKTVKT